MAKLEELTGFDEDFFWENINVGYTTIANSLIYKDIGCLLENTEPSRRNYAALMAAHVLADDRLKKHADKNREEELDTKDMILGISLHQGSRMANLQELNHFRRLHVFDLFRHARSRIISRQKGVQV